MNLNTCKTLNNGVEIPIFGLGVYKSAEHTKQAVLYALEAGYRHIDTAALYNNENHVGEAIRESGVWREDIFVTTKMWNDDIAAGNYRGAFEQSLKQLGMEYVDLYLIHWPVAPGFKQAWKVMESLYEEGLVRAIGVSNFHTNHLMELLSGANIVPAMNQIECHPYLNQKALRSLCKNLSIEVTAWSPLGRARVLDDQKIISLAKEYGKTAAQIILRWELQEGMITIPKSVHQKRIIENADIFDFELSNDAMDIMNSLNRDQRYGTNPDTF